MSHWLLLLVNLHQLILSPSLLLLNHVLKVLFFFESEQRLLPSVLLQKLSIFLFLFLSSLLLCLLLGPALLVSLPQSLVLLFSHLLLKLFVLHCALHFQRFHLVLLALLLNPYLLLLLLDSSYKLLRLPRSLTQQMKAVSPYFSIFLFDTRGDTERVYNSLGDDLALIKLFLEVHDFAFDEHVLEFDSMRWFWLRRGEFRLMLDVVYLVNAFLDIVMDVELDLTHGQVELVGEGLVIEDLLLYARNKTSVVVVISAQVHFVLNEFYPLLHGQSDVHRHHFLRLFEGILNHICLVNLMRVFLYFFRHLRSQSSLLLLPPNDADLLLNG